MEKIEIGFQAGEGRDINGGVNYANSGKTEHLFRTTGTLIPFETEQNY